MVCSLKSCSRRPVNTGATERRSFYSIPPYQETTWDLFVVVGAGYSSIAQILAHTGRTLPCPATFPRYVTVALPNSHLAKLRVREASDRRSNSARIPRQVSFPRVTIDDHVIQVHSTSLKTWNNPIHWALKRLMTWYEYKPEGVTDFLCPFSQGNLPVSF